MVSNCATEDGMVTQVTSDYYEARARGGVGLVIVEATHIDFPRGRGFTRQLSVADDRHMPGLAGLCQAVKRHGAACALQIVHSGAATRPSLSGEKPVAPSAIAVPGFDIPRELTEQEIGDLVRQFGDAAARAKKAGFDGVEIHAAHFYLIARFLSPACNKRLDGYGGNTEKRARFLQETIQAMKRAAGKDYPVWCRINGEEYGCEDALTSEEARSVAALAEQAGADAVHVSCWDVTNSAYWDVRRWVSTMRVPAGYLIHLAQGIKEAVKVPVIAVGRITPQLGESALREGKADLIAVGRGLIADPELPLKLATGRAAQIAPCVACGDCSKNRMVCSQV